MDTDQSKIVLFGAGRLGKMALYALKSKGFHVEAFYDSRESKQGNTFCDKKILSLKDLSLLDKKTNIYITNNYISYVTKFLKKLGFVNIYNCVNLFKQVKNVSYDTYFNEYDLKSLDREIFIHKSACEKLNGNQTDTLNLKCIDVVATERCSMKCKDCSNLMQYYEKPQNSNMPTLFDTLDTFMNCVDHLYEFRVLGGDPFMNKDLNKIVKKLVMYDNAENTVIYTNATILPKGENLECLKNEKITIEITNYGPELSRKHDELVKILKENKIKYRSRPPGDWNNCGTLKYYERTEEELQRVFDNCCMSDVTTMMDGILYRCPFAAHATNLKAAPFKKDEVVNLNNNEYDKKILKNKIRDFNKSEKPLTACSYCGGRDYKSEIIKPAIQTKVPLQYKKI